MKYILTFQVKKQSPEIAKTASSKLISKFLLSQTWRTISNAQNNTYKKKMYI